MDGIEGDERDRKYPLSLRIKRLCRAAQPPGPCAGVGLGRTLSLMCSFQYWTGLWSARQGVVRLFMGFSTNTEMSAASARKA